MAWTEKVASRFSHLHPTVYGLNMHEIVGLGDHSDIAYGTENIDPHTDVPYYKHQAGMVVFHGILNNCEGGDSYLVDAFNIAEQLRSKYPDLFDLLTTIHIPFRSKANEDNIRDLTVTEPTIALNPLTGELVAVRYNHYDRAPINTIPQDQMAAYYAALSKFSLMVEDPQSQIWFRLQPGSVVFVDNFRILHARTAFNGRRILYSCYLPRDDVLSKTRLLGLLWYIYIYNV